MEPQDPAQVPAKRLKLRRMLTDILGTTGAQETRTYFQSPGSEMMKYPAIVYERSRIQNRFADDRVYLQSDEYQITVIDENPDSEIVRQVSLLPKCQHDRHFVADNLHHDVFTIYI